VFSPFPLRPARLEISLRSLRGVFILFRLRDDTATRLSAAQVNSLLLLALIVAKTISDGNISRDLQVLTSAPSKYELM